MKEVYFQTKTLGVGYHGRPLIKEINIAAGKGEIITLIGPNGAGKSTVLKSIARQLALIEGAVYLDKVTIASMQRESLAQKMAVVLTDKIQAELLTCEEVVEAGRYPYTGRFGILSEQDRAIVAEAMELVQITELKEYDFTKISDGQKQRVMLARAICQEPEIIILDEPTSYLDVKYKLEFLSALQRLKEKKQLTVIMSLHELELAERVSDKILCLKGEYVERYGTPGEIFTPNYVQSLFGIEEGSFDEGNGTMELAAPKGEAEIFVIAGGGSGRAVYRKLQRENCPFVTGILYTNDLDFPTAKALAAEVIEAEAFEPISQALVEEGKKRIDRCKKVICCKESFGTFEQGNKELFAYAKLAGKV